MVGLFGISDFGLKKNLLNPQSSRWDSFGDSGQASGQPKPRAVQIPYPADLCDQQERVEKETLSALQGACIFQPRDSSRGDRERILKCYMIAEYLPGDVIHSATQGRPPGSPNYAPCKSTILFRNPAPRTEL